MLAIQTYDTVEREFKFHYFSKRSEYKKNIKKICENSIISSLRILYSGKKWMLISFVQLTDAGLMLNCEQVELNGLSISFLRQKIEFKALREKIPKLKILGISNILWQDFAALFVSLLEIKFSSVVFNEFPRNLNLNIQRLLISGCDLELVDVLDFSQFLQLNELSIVKSNLKICPIFPLNGVLQNIHLFGNQLCALSEIPASVKHIYVHCNNIVDLPTVPIQVETLILSHNPLRRLPCNILLCRNLSNLYFLETEIELTLPEIRMIELINNPELRARNRTHFYNDSQNVHNTFIQKSFLHSAQNLFMDNIPDYEFDTTDDAMADMIVHKSFRNTERHIVLNLSFKDIFQKVWNRIQHEKSNERKSQLKERLVQEIIDGNEKCFTGKITRIVNSLVSFYPDIQIQIGTCDQIRAKIAQSISKNFGVLNRHEITMELRELDIDEKTIDEWLTAYQENE